MKRHFLCFRSIYTRESSNPLVLDNWRFWVVPTSTINKLCGDNKKISLNRLKSITKQPDGIGFSQLKAAVDHTADPAPPQEHPFHTIRSNRHFRQVITPYRNGAGMS